MPMTPDAIVRIRMLDKESEDVRIHAPIFTREFNCPLFFTLESGHDARVYLEDVQLPLSPGDEITAVIKFLYSEDVAHLLHIGRGFRLWESGFFAEGEVLATEQCSTVWPDEKPPEE